MTKLMRSSCACFFMRFLIIFCTWVSHCCPRGVERCSLRRPWQRAATQLLAVNTKRCCAGGLGGSGLCGPRQAPCAASPGEQPAAFHPEMRALGHRSESDHFQTLLAWDYKHG